MQALFCSTCIYPGIRHKPSTIDVIVLEKWYIHNQIFVATYIRQNTTKNLT